MTRRRPVVAIDGPAGAGKSTVTQLVAQRLRYALIGTGSIYRAVALLALQGGVAADDGPALARLAASLSEPQGLRFIADERVIYPVARSSRASGLYGVSGIPDAMLIGKDGKVVWRDHPGYIDFGIIIITDFDETVIGQTQI